VRALREQRTNMGAVPILFVVGASYLAYFFLWRGEDAEPQLRASNEDLLRPRVARATEVGVLAPPPSSLCFRWRPI
jgi:hypothetical protein